jgi:hypothetical protein
MLEGEIMPKTKPKLNQERKEKRTARQIDTKPDYSDLDLELLRQFWEEEVEVLSRSVFDSEEEVLRALITKVIDRMPKTAFEGSDKELKEFLFNLVDSDTELKNSLSFLVK